MAKRLSKPRRGMREGSTCWVVGAHRRTIHHQPLVRDDKLQVRELGSINHKRIQRLCRLEDLAIRPRKRKRVA